MTCFHLMVYLKLLVDSNNALLLHSFLYVHVRMYVQGNNVFYCVDEYNFNTQTQPRGEKMGLVPTDMSGMFLETAQCLTEIQATLMMHTCYTVWKNIYYNFPDLAKVLVM
jgi:hypothetical protein